MPTGTIKTWIEPKGYGFIRYGTAADEIFFHISQWLEEHEPARGQTVEFREDIGRDRRKFARDVRKVNGAG